MLYLLAIASARLSGVVLPFPDVADPSPAEVAATEVEPAPVEAKAEASSEDTVAAWTPPTQAPDEFATSADAFKHPSKEVVKDWETAPKVEIFAPVASEATEDTPKPKKIEAALPVVKSSLEPIIATHQDDDPELAAIQQENPLAYGIVKALLLKKEMGLPLPGANTVQRQANVGDGAEHAPASSKSIGNMFAWKPSDSASEGADDELAAVEQSEEVEKAPAPEESIVAAPQRVEEPKPEPKVSAVEDAEPKATGFAAEEEPKAEEPAKEEPKPALVSSSSSLSDFLGASVAPAEPAAPVEQKKPSAYSDAMTSYMNDLA